MKLHLNPQSTTEVFDEIEKVQSRGENVELIILPPKVKDWFPSDIVKADDGDYYQNGNTFINNIPVLFEDWKVKPEAQSLEPKFLCTCGHEIKQHLANECNLKDLCGCKGFRFSKV